MGNRGASCIRGSTLSSSGRMQVAAPRCCCCEEIIVESVVVDVMPVAVGGRRALGFRRSDTGSWDAADVIEQRMVRGGSR